MGVTEVDRLSIPSTNGPRPRSLRLTRGRPWSDPILDHAVDAVRDRRLRIAIPVLADTRSDPEVRSLRIEALARAAVGRSQGIEFLLAEDPTNYDLWLWLGRTRIEEAWSIRPDGRARAVQAAGFRSYSALMESARSPLTISAEKAPDDPVPWECMLWLALGLGLDREIKDLFWSRAEERLPTLYGAHVVRLMTLSPQWGGLAEEMFDFARLAASMAARDDPRAALVPLSYFEYSVQERSSLLRGASSWFSDRECREVAAAACGWFEGTRPHPRTIEAHNLFGAAFHLADARRPARQHLARTYGRPSRLPWTYLGGDETDQFAKACRHLNLQCA